MKLLLRSVCLLLLLSALSCEDVRKNRAFTRGNVRIGPVGQSSHVITLNNLSDLTDRDGAFEFDSAEVGLQTIEILSPISGDLCVSADVTIVAPITVVQFNLVRETNGDISGSVNTLTSGPDEQTAIPAFTPPADCF